MMIRPANGSHANGLTGLNIWMNGFMAALTQGLMPHRTPTGTAINVAIPKPKNTVPRLVKIWSTNVGALDA